MRSVVHYLLGCLLVVSAGWAAGAELSIRVAFGESLEPYVMADSNNGIEVDIIRAAFAVRGIAVTPQYVSQPRLATALESPGIDAVATLGRQSGIRTNYSNTYVSYDDVAITLKSRQLKLTQIADLVHYNVLAYSNAKIYLGPEFHVMANKNPHYAEAADQMNQNRLLYRGAIDVVVADRRIFQWMDHKLEPQFHEKPQPVEMYHLFPPTEYQLACRTSVLCDTFNQGLKIIQKNGEYDRILARYH
ncbi:substrate-binding periplasmic protein [Paludibacterium purpuratum]|uniref:Amino acid ABC transporter substrate-binding protein (PAAT family) n=1 Tax=Paludibacterium purpuratum TaxID=1144873 RepID=A0A4R7B843_9NEIS|nr:transporter substrate-binding domain-containing protein [Paludibacterium purpuratum]TDR80693.1 amino acid ABC transporter substrate-binding protein (PAAT family) [Paludibacterium purpuratum]